MSDAAEGSDVGTLFGTVGSLSFVRVGTGVDCEASVRTHTSRSADKIK
jgi:hypothetical protein